MAEKTQCVECGRVMWTDENYHSSFTLPMCRGCYEDLIRRDFRTTVGPSKAGTDWRHGRPKRPYKSRAKKAKQEPQ